MARSGKKFESGGPFIWLTGAALAACLLMIVGLVGVVAPRALAALWPDRLVEITLVDGKKYVVALLAREPIPAASEGAGEPGSRVQVRLGNRDLYGLDFRWIPESQIVSRRSPPDAVLVERQEYGPFQGYLRKVVQGEEAASAGSGPFERLAPLLEEARERSRRLRRLEKRDIGAVNYRIEQKRLELRAIRQEGPAARAAARNLIVEIEAEVKQLERRYETLRERANRLKVENERAQVTLADANGEEKTLPVSSIVRIFRPNRLDLLGRLKVYFSRLGEFIADEPRESNTEGGVFPAIFGTVMMVVIMSAAVMPFGVLAALYLREYARQGPLVRAVRIAVNNLAGVPSIVFGVFGLGFFVYLTGGAIDRLFYSERLPDPTFKTGGILWASLTLALLTVPVVIVATEESLAAVPRGARDGSYALGATKWQTIRRIVLPAAAPGILTGLILAMARGAGEVAPLMITGVVKLAQDLPFDPNPPFLHFERKFMHLGFHIYDVGFQSPNVEAAKPMVYLTTLLLLAVIVALNLTAILVRERLRRKLRTATF
ncbi:MAG TPA: phosphate ABC transporter permease PstA [Thermoanaerobaculia bacterium]|nr:phosphate ABC transporter permease PstA [Thermoanaerobaculia bacterium]